MNKNIKPISIILLVILLGAFLIGVSNVYPQPQYLEEEINVRIDTYGGNIRTVVKISGPYLTELDNLEAYIPKDFYNESNLDVIKVEGKKGEDRFDLPFNIEEAGENFAIKINLNRDIDTLIISFFQPERLKPVSPGRYIANVMSFLKLNVNVRSSEVVIDPPLDTSAIAEQLPIGYSQIQVSPEGVTPAQFEISKVMSETDIKIVNKTVIDEIVLTQVTTGRTSLILADTWVSIMLKPDFEGRLIGEMNLTLKNKDLIVWPSETEIQIDDTYKVLEVKTELGMPVDFEYTGRVYKLNLPYDVRPNNKITFNIIFAIEDDVSLKGEFIPVLEYDVELPPPMTIPIDEFILYRSWTNDVITKEPFMPTDDKIKLSGQLNLDIQSLLTQTGLSYVLFTIFLLSIGFVTYKGLNKVLQEELPEEVKDYLESFIKEMDVMAEAIELERKHMEGKIKDKEYIKQKSKLHKKIKDIKRAASKNREILKKLSEESDTLKELFEDIKEVEKAWDELNKLEDSRRRRAITLEEYREMRKELIVKFEMYASKIRRRV